MRASEVAVPTPRGTASVAEPGRAQGTPVDREGLQDVFAVLGKRWSGMLIGELIGGPARFTELMHTVPGISEPMLSRRLAELCRLGLVTRLVRAGPPPGSCYALTADGRALTPAFRELAEWGRAHLAADS